MTVTTMIVGALVTILGYYVPFMIFAGCIMTIGMGLISTFTPSANKGAWIGYQVSLLNPMSGGMI